MGSSGDQEAVEERRILSKLTVIKSDHFHLLHPTISAQKSTLSRRFLLPQCRKEPFSRSFLPVAITLYNSGQNLSIKEGTEHFLHYDLEDKHHTLRIVQSSAPQ